VWGTKGRRKILKAYVLPELRKAFYEVVQKHPTLWIEAFNTDEDHVHVQIEIPPNILVADAVSKLKSISSQRLRKKFKYIREIYLEKDGIWSVGYFSSTVGLNETKIRRYIEWQGNRDKPQKARLF
jgi:putative transposase